MSGVQLILLSAALVGAGAMIGRPEQIPESGSALKERYSLYNWNEGCGFNSKQLLSYQEQTTNVPQNKGAYDTLVPELKSRNPDDLIANYLAKKQYDPTIGQFLTMDLNNQPLSTIPKPTSANPFGNTYQEFV